MTRETENRQKPGEDGEEDLGGGEDDRDGGGQDDDGDGIEREGVLAC